MMINKYNYSARPQHQSGTLILPQGHILVADDIDVLGNWNDLKIVEIFMKSGEQYSVNINPVLALEMYLTALNGDVVDHQCFKRSKSGYSQKHHSGLLVMPDQNNSIIAILAENISSLSCDREKTDYKNKSGVERMAARVDAILDGDDSDLNIHFETKACKPFSALCPFEMVKDGYIRAMNGENITIWPTKWEFERADLSKSSQGRDHATQLRFTS